MRIPGVPYVQGRNAYTDRDGHKYGIAIHNTSNDASAEAEASYATRRTDGISAHLYCDADSVVQSLDTNSRAGHAGSYEGNEHAIAVEITGMNSWTRQQWLDRVAWAKLGAALAYVCAAYGIAVRRASVAEMQSNPKVKAFYSHDDMRRAWGKTTHTDPGPNFPWDRLFTAVNAALGEDDDMTPEQDRMLRELYAERRVAPWAYKNADAAAAAKVAGQPYPDMHQRVLNIEAKLDKLAAALAAAGGTVDTASILAGVDQRLAAARADMRDAVGDLGEGGAAKVRGPQA